MTLVDLNEEVVRLDENLISKLSGFVKKTGFSAAGIVKKSW